MKFLYKLIFIFSLFTLISKTNPNPLGDALFDIKNNIEVNLTRNLLSNDGINILDILSIINKFIENKTNIYKGKDTRKSLENCIVALIEKIDNDIYRNLMNILAYSGKGLSDLGLENPCKTSSSNLTYYLLTYEFTKESFKNDSKDSDLKLSLVNS